MNAQLQPSTITTTQAERLDMKCIIGIGDHRRRHRGCAVGRWHRPRRRWLDVRPPCRNQDLRRSFDGRGDGYAAEKAASRHDLSYSDAQILVAIAKEDCAAKGLPH